MKLNKGKLRVMPWKKRRSSDLWNGLPRDGGKTRQAGQRKLRWEQAETEIF